LTGRASIDLSGVRVLVTASTRGIGFYVARGLAEMGASVAVTGRSEEGLTKAVAEIRAVGGKVIGIRADLARRKDIERVFEVAIKFYGGLDAVVFNVGNISCEPCYPHEADYSDWLEAAALHLVAPGYLTTLALRYFLERGGGSIVYLSSVTVREPMPHFALADAARSGLVQLAKAVARHYGSRGIRANVVLMGSFDTPGARRNIAAIAERRGISFDDAWRRLVLEATPLGRVGRPEEIAKLVAYLISSDSDYINGASVVIDGAMSRCA
jgi:NAD(P)-dependent dehydrogenase (short-subunit alcohol dehydrogenase family)